MVLNFKGVLTGELVKITDIKRPPKMEVFF